MPNPMPIAPPVTIALFPVRSNGPRSSHVISPFVVRTDRTVVGFGAPRHVRTHAPGGLRLWVVEGFASYEGKSGFLWLKVLLAAALWVLLEGGIYRVA